MAPMISGFSCWLLSTLFRARVLVVGPVTVHLKATLCLPRRIINLCYRLVMDLNDYTNPQFMETIGKTHNGP